MLLLLLLLLTMMTMMSVCVTRQIRVVNAFQEPSSTPAQLPYKGRPSFANIVTMTARTAAASTGEQPAPPPPTTADVATPALVVIENEAAE